MNLARLQNRIHYRRDWTIPVLALHAHLIEEGRANVVCVTDDEALEAVFQLCKLEGIIPALESAHALAALSKINIRNQTVVITLSGRVTKICKSMQPI